MKNLVTAEVDLDRGDMVDKLIKCHCGVARDSMQFFFVLGMHETEGHFLGMLCLFVCLFSKNYSLLLYSVF